jgi:hypothetical protein
VGEADEPKKTALAQAGAELVCIEGQQPADQEPQERGEQKL